MRLNVVERSDFTWERRATENEEALRQVAAIVADVRERGDAAVDDWTAKLDKQPGASLRVPQAALQAAFEALAPELREALALAADRIRRYHEAQWPEDFTLYGDDGEQLGLVWRPLRRVGVYAPGGRGAYPSTVLMDVIPAQVAGVAEIALVSPPGPTGLPHPQVLAAAHLLGIDEVYAVGGAQAVAALAYGTKTIARVDKIVGPGNLYVALAKRLVMGDVGIDSIAGPSEVLIIADEAANPRYIAADMLAQAEHDPEAGALCVSPSIVLLEQVADELERQLVDLPRAEIAQQALARWGALVHVESLAEAANLCNQLAPEHVELLVDHPEELLSSIHFAGAVFLGEATPEPVGDYFAGSNHVLPTHGSARYASGLGTHDFLRRMSVVAYSQKTLAKHARHIVALAEAEGLTAHARSILVRQGADHNDR
ncbi:histidinol dehydrogenase [Alicyclobacillus hesperidum subsp. aegles]|uniref:histidinol dehydrogenase n=1 Tax=Alicyclobacillus hesperidum TaxID=89784 RepID=UPI00222BEA25|nr:histidinol dehydrogenase [Alicyclobacillus hesperidum]GLF99967.1 histidinol dehydrogenase [Alicyclobacillus hesperidum subsp. aegles]